MKLHRLTLKNFRAVRDVTVCPADSGVTVIEGRNEAGKSSLAEALNMLLTVKDRSKAQAVKNVSPADSGAGPEITAELSSGPYRFEYHKRFLSKPSTTLRVDTPKPESLSGDEAHQRVEAILEETMDAELWSALRVEQGSSHALADLSRQAALSAALDEAAAGSRGDGSDEDLFTRVENLFFGFFTRRPGNPEGKVLVEARERVQRLETTAEELAEEQRRLDGDVNKARELGREIARDEQAMQPLKDEETNARESLRAAQERQQVVERLRGEATLAASRRDTASLAHKTRQGMLEQLASHSATSDELLAQSQAAEAAIDAAREQQRDSKAALDTAQARADEAAGLALAAQAAVAASRAAKELERLQRTREDARQVAAQLRKSERFLAACTVTPEALAKARDAESHHLQVTSKATSRAPRLQVTALTPLKIDHDGSVNDVPAGSTHEAGLTDGAVLTIADVAELRLEAGGDQNEHQRAVADSARALKAALAALGTASTADAEKQ
ncbi:MAG: AAA family ATPase, partial [Pseudomonadota bacterium]